MTVKSALMKGQFVPIPHLLCHFHTHHGVSCSAVVFVDCSLEENLPLLKLGCFCVSKMKLIVQWNVKVVTTSQMSTCGNLDVGLALKCVFLPSAGVPVSSRVSAKIQQLVNTLKRPKRPPLREFFVDDFEELLEGK